MFIKALTSNPIVSCSIDGFRKSGWYNSRQTQSGTTKGYDVKVYGNTPSDANALGSALKAYLERMIPKTDISIGVRQPQYDIHTQGYYTTLVVLHGKGLHRGSFAPRQKPKPPVTGKQFSKAFNKEFQ